MKHVKYRLENLVIYNYKEVEKHLSSMAAKGWRLEKVGAPLWKYRRAEPARVHYAVAYIQDSSQFNPEPTERQQMLEELCNAAGWEKVCDWFQMQIYCSEAEQPVPLETEESLRLEAVHQSMKRNFLPVSALFLAYALYQLGKNLYTLFTNPLRVLASNSRLFLIPLLLLLAVIILSSLVCYGLWYRRSARSVDQGGSCTVPPNLRPFNRAASVFLVFWVAMYLLSLLTGGQGGIANYFVLYLLLYVLIVFAVRKLIALLRRLKLSWGVNLFLTLTAIVVLAFLTVSAGYSIAEKRGWFGGPTGETYTYEGYEWDVSPISLPLTVSDLTGETYSHIQREDISSGSFLLPQRTCRETVMEGTGQDGLYYEITTPLGWMYDTAVRCAISPQKESVSFGNHHISGVYTWEEVSAVPWGAERAYRRLTDGNPGRTWLLIFPDRLAEISFSPNPTPEQMALVGEALKSA